MSKVIRDNYWKVVSATLGVVVLYCVAAGAKSWGSDVWVTREAFVAHKDGQTKLEAELRADDAELRAMLKEHLTAMRDLEKAEQATRERLAEMAATLKRVDSKLPN